MRLIYFGDVIEKAALVSCKDRHAFILTLEYERQVAIKAGFGSGYNGEGPRGLSKALLLLERHCDGIEEYRVSEAFIDRIDDSCLTPDDIDSIEAAQPIRPTRYHDYIFEKDHGDDKSTFEDLIENLDSSPEVIARSSEQDRLLNRLFPKEIPFGILDDRIVDLAFKFRSAPDGAILTAYKRLEGIIRRKIGGSEKSGSALISDAFLKEDSPLCWQGEHQTEQKGRAQLFVGAFMAFRNRRAHREICLSPEEELREFLLVNELYHLESAATLRFSGTPEC